MRARVLCLLLTAWACACRDPGTQRRPEEEPGPRCGDGRIDTGEACDGSNLGTETCQTQSFEGGSLACSADCQLVTQGCTRRCGNGALDPGEGCDGALGLTACSTWGYQSCSPSCALETGRCITQPYTAAPVLSRLKGGPSIQTDLTPPGLGDLVLAVPSMSRLETFAFVRDRGFVEDRKIAGASPPLLAVAGDLNGDGRVDLASLALDGSAERYLDTQAGFPTTPLHTLDGGASCAPFVWLGAAKVDVGDAVDLIALGCLSAGRGNALLVFRGGAAPAAAEVHPLAGIVAGALGDWNGDGRVDALVATDTELKVLGLDSAGSASPLATLPMPSVARRLAAADLDGDGDLDLAVADATQVSLLENTGASLAPRYSQTSTDAEGLWLGDLDGDQRTDLAYLSAGKVELRRAAGSFQFLPYSVTTGTGTALSLGASDLDGDGDVDLTATYATGGDSTETHVLLNRVR